MVNRKLIFLFISISNTHNLLNLTNIKTNSRIAFPMPIKSKRICGYN